MRLRPDQLGAHLKKSLLPVYLLSGDELLLMQQCSDAIRQHCRQNGIAEREVLEVDRSFNWEQLLAAGQSMSLFGDRKLIELRLGNAKMDQKSSALLQDYLQHSDGGNVLLISTGKIDKRSLGAKWVKAIEDIGAVIQVWPIERSQLPRWIQQRMQALGMKASSEAVELLADRVEGNLLAADQEIAKLHILIGEQPLTLEQVAGAVASSARYDIFQLLDTALAGNAGHSLQMLHSLLAEGNDEIAMLGAISRELRILYQCAQAAEQGQNIERALDAARIWDKKKAVYKRALQRLSSAKLGVLIQGASRIDAAQKGQSADNGRTLLSELIAALAGQPVAAARPGISA